jgi:hypothetical protein
MPDLMKPISHWVDPNHPEPPSEMGLVGSILLWIADGGYLFLIMVIGLVLVLIEPQWFR